MVFVMGYGAIQMNGMDLDTVWISSSSQFWSVWYWNLQEFLLKTCSIRGLAGIFECFQKSSHSLMPCDTNDYRYLSREIGVGRTSSRQLLLSKNSFVCGSRGSDVSVPNTSIHLENYPLTTSKPQIMHCLICGSMIRHNYKLYRKHIQLCTQHPLCIVQTVSLAQVQPT